MWFSVDLVAGFCRVSLGAFKTCFQGGNAVDFEKYVSMVFGDSSWVLPGVLCGSLST